MYGQVLIIQRMNRLFVRICSQALFVARLPGLRVHVSANPCPVESDADCMVGYQLALNLKPVRAKSELLSAVAGIAGNFKNNHRD